MDSKDLVACQREALAAFRQAGQERHAREREAARGLETAEKKAADQRKVVQAQSDLGRNWLGHIQREHLLDMAAGFFRPSDGGQMPADALACETSRARPAAAEVEASVKEWQAFRRAVTAAQRAENYAQAALKDAATAERYGETADGAWQAIQSTQHWKAAIYFRYKVESAREQASEASRQAREAARQANQASAQVQDSLSSSESAAAVEQAASQAEKRAEAAATKAAEYSRNARQAAEAAEQAATKARAAADRVRSGWRRLAAVVAVGALAVAALAYYLEVAPRPHYQAALRALAAEEWQRARAELEPLALRWKPYRDSRTLLLISYLHTAMSAVNAQDWATAAETMVALNQVEYNYGESLSLAADHASLAQCLTDQYTQAWLEGEVKQLATLSNIDIGRLAFSSDGQWLVTTVVTAGSSAIDVRRIAGGEIVNALEYDKVVSHLALSPDGKQMALSAGDEDIIVGQTSPDTGWTVFWTALHVGVEEVRRLGFSSDSSQLIALTDRGVYWWRTTDGSVLDTVAVGVLDVRRVDVATNGRLLVATVAGTILQIWEPDTDWRRYELSRPSTGGVIVAPDGQRVAVAVGPSVEVWRTSGAQLYSLAGGDEQTGSYVQALAFSPEGAILATGSYEGIVKLWRASDGTFLTQFRAVKDGKVENLTFMGPGGALLVVTGVDGSVSFWQPQRELSEQ